MNIYVGATVVGVVEDGEFRKYVFGSKHFLQRPPAISFDIDSLIAAKDAGAYIVTVVDRETNDVYQVNLDTILQYGFSVTRGHGDQIALPLPSWHKSTLH